jgi:hypothetical protein
MAAFIVIVVLIGLLPAAIAAGKGRSFVAWWIYGMAIFIVALPHALMLKRDQRALDRRALKGGQMIKCPHCAELVKREAQVCRYCNRELRAA